MLLDKWLDEMLAFSAGLGGRGRGISWLPGRVEEIHVDSRSGEPPTYRYYTVADYCETEGIWLHVDAAHGGALAIVPAGARLLEGIARRTPSASTPTSGCSSRMKSAVCWSRMRARSRGRSAFTTTYSRIRYGALAIRTGRITACS